MLTIRVIQEDGRELLKEVSSVMRRPGEETLTRSDCITYFEDENAIDVFDGTIYVMNENGKTIAVYKVSSKWIVPQGEPTKP